jgi:LPXTG-site transpeptidase (sortase) family protein
MTWIAVLCLLYAGYQFWVTDLLAARTQQQLRAAGGNTAIPARPAAPSASGSTVSTGPSPVVLQIPRLDLDLVVMGGTSRANLRRGPGLLPGTPPPGRAGNSVVAGHRTTWGAPFGRLDELRPGDRIFAGPAGDVAEYTVVPPDGAGSSDGHRIVLPTDRSVARQELRGDRLTLVTCHPRFSAAQRLVVVAQRSGPRTAASVPAVPVGDVPDLGQLDFGSGDPPQWWSEVLPPGATAPLIWAAAGMLSTGPPHRRRWRRVLRWVGWRLTGAALATVPLLVVFDRVSAFWPTG